MAGGQLGPAAGKGTEKRRIKGRAEKPIRASSCQRKRAPRWGWRSWRDGHQGGLRGPGWPLPLRGHPHLDSGCWAWLRVEGCRWGRLPSPGPGGTRLHPPRTGALGCSLATVPGAARHGRGGEQVSGEPVPEEAAGFPSASAAKERPLTGQATAPSPLPGTGARARLLSSFSQRTAPPPQSHRCPPDPWKGCCAGASVAWALWGLPRDGSSPSFRNSQCWEAACVTAGFPGAGKAINGSPPRCPRCPFGPQPPASQGRAKRGLIASPRPEVLSAFLLIASFGTVSEATDCPLSVADGRFLFHLDPSGPGFRDPAPGESRSERHPAGAKQAAERQAGSRLGGHFLPGCHFALAAGQESHWLCWDPSGP